MAKRLDVASMLEPLEQELVRLMQNRDEHDPIAMVQAHLTKLLGDLRDENKALRKVEVLAQLGFLSEHSQREELIQFHETIERAVRETITEGSG